MKGRVRRSGTRAQGLASPEADPTGGGAMARLIRLDRTGHTTLAEWNGAQMVALPWPKPAK